MFCSRSVRDEPEAVDVKVKRSSIRVAGTRKSAKVKVLHLDGATVRVPFNGEDVVGTQWGLPSQPVALILHGYRYVMGEHKC
jgi:hypothetical protein